MILKKPSFLAFIICALFVVLFSVLSIVRHNHYDSYGYDLGINDQTVWRYSTFQLPITTIDPHPDKTKLYMHVEFVYAIISPVYWIWSSRKMLLITEVIFLVSGGYAFFLMSQKKLKNTLLSFAILISYLMFFGVQNAVWFDVHSVSFAAAFLSWFLYFLDLKKAKLSFLFFVLSITSKENIALYTLVIALLYIIRRREKWLFAIAGLSVMYLLFIFYVFFPHIMHVSYQYQNKDGLLSNINPYYLFNTKEKLQTIFYSFGSFGFLPLLNPLTLPLIFTHFATFFVIASDLPGAQGLFGQYRVTLAPLFSWATITTIATYKFLNKKWVAIYLIFSTLLIQYFLHLPLSYLAKSWFWEEPKAVKNINALISNYLPKNASVVSQNNITPHISHRDKIYTLYPTVENNKYSFTWYDNPQFLIVDTSSNWDARHLLTDNEKFNEGLLNLEKEGQIKLYKEVGNAKLFKVISSNK